MITNMHFKESISIITLIERVCKRQRELPLHPVMWLHSFSLHLHSDWHLTPNVGYRHGISNMLPVYPNGQPEREQNLNIKEVDHLI